MWEIEQSLSKVADERGFERRDQSRCGMVRISVSLSATRWDREIGISRDG